MAGFIFLLNLSSRSDVVVSKSIVIIEYKKLYNIRWILLMRHDFKDSGTCAFYVKPLVISHVYTSVIHQIKSCQANNKFISDYIREVLQNVSCLSTSKAVVRF